MVFITKSGNAVNLDRVNYLYQTRESGHLFEVFASFTSGDQAFVEEFKTEEDAKHFIRWLATKIESMKNPPPVNYGEYFRWFLKEVENPRQRLKEVNP